MENLTPYQIGLLMEGVSRLIRSNKAGANRQKVPSKSGDRKALELMALEKLQDKLLIAWVNGRAVSIGK